MFLICSLFFSSLLMTKMATNNSTTRVKKFFELTFLALLVIVFCVLRLYNSGYSVWTFHTINRTKETNPRDLKLTNQTSKFTTTSKPDLKIPWRYHSDDDGFVFPRDENYLTSSNPHLTSFSGYLTYEPIQRSLTRQLLQFENAVIFAYFLKRILIVPPIILIKENKTIEIPVSTIIDFDLLSTMVRLVEMPTNYKELLNIRTTYEVCQDPRLGFWLDYIPSPENINSWRTLKQQLFSPLKLRFDYHNQTNYWCPGTEKYFDRWGPPLQIKALYRGVLTELYERSEDLIMFQSSTLDTSDTRFFDRKRVRTAQEILLFYIRFSSRITRYTKHLADVLGYGYIAILANGISNRNTNLNQYLVDSLRKFNTTSMTVFIVSGRVKKTAFQGLRDAGYNLVFADQFTERIKKWSLRKEISHVFSLLLCAYAAHFIGFPGTPDLYFVEHLRLQDVKIVDGLVAEKINVKWAKHTTKRKADDRKIFQKRPSLKPLVKQSNTKKEKQKISASDLASDAMKSTITSSKIQQSKIGTHHKIKQNNRHSSFFKDGKLYNIACTFCNYVTYVTGQNGCPTMKVQCSSNKL
ncbi:uncharacterized protein [Clytia hemisphaerica]